MFLAGKDPRLLGGELGFGKDALFLQCAQILELLESVLSGSRWRRLCFLFSGLRLTGGLLFLLRPTVRLATPHATGDGRRGARDGRGTRDASK
jgi:hypothetical protein